MKGKSHLLTPTELQIPQTAVHEVTSDCKGLARILRRNRHTVRKHLDNTLGKLEVHSRFEAAVMALGERTIFLKGEAAESPH